MYVHKGCVPEGAEQDLEKVAHGYCGVCGKRATIWHVKGTEDSYKTKIQGVTKTITAVGTLTDEDVTFIKTKLNTTDIAPVDTGPEVELPEESEAMVEAPTEAIGPITEEAIELEKEPDKTPVEAESDDLVEAVVEAVEALVDAEMGLEAVSEPPEPAMPEPPAEMPPVGMPAEAEPELTEEEIADLADIEQKATIARLEAELEALRK